MERVSLVGAFFFAFRKAFFFSVSKVYDKESLFEPISFCEWPLHLQCVFENFFSEIGSE